MKFWLHLFKPGDWLILVLAIGVTVASFMWFWRGGVAERALVKRDGEIVASLSLDGVRRLEVQGAMGVTVIETAPGRVRIASDPGVHQYCVKQGWLSAANAIAICAPNHISLMLVGRDSVYDSLSY